MRTYTPPQVRAIKFSMGISRKIARDLPEIANSYVAGVPCSEIVKEYDIMKRYGIPNPQTARVSVQYALARLLSKELLEDLADSHWFLNGYRTFVEGIGIFASDEARIEYARKGGKINGTHMAKHGLGIHTLEKRRKGGRNCVISRGFKPWSDEEIEYVLTKSKLPEYKKNGKVNVKKLAEELGVKPLRIRNFLSKVRLGERCTQ